ncbi:hypothetical protein PI124_g19197 [Phytophthora idaei]|nr:hypothetical protein PI125_g24460 [Phytophthora idaei]KAG3126005.1 hypothetical protein PI126_g22516 [Phytophthora idaei]KAG3235778.1 hypothetical protein PI124_g19197 [Phytophthora idaei]
MFVYAYVYIRDPSPSAASQTNARSTTAQIRTDEDPHHSYTEFEVRHLMVPAVFPIKILISAQTWSGSGSMSIEMPSKTAGATLRALEWRLEHFQAHSE